jgi:hypothetical protein
VREYQPSAITLKSYGSLITGTLNGQLTAFSLDIIPKQKACTPGNELARNSFPGETLNQARFHKVF